MTANELANELHKLFVGEEYDRLVHEIPDLLRQKAVEIIDLECEKERQREKFEEMLCDRDVEIEALKKELALQKLFDIGQEIETLDTRSYLIGRYDGLRELTDEEIDELANKYLYVLNDVPYANDIKNFARAILKKAGEK